MKVCRKFQITHRWDGVERRGRQDNVTSASAAAEERKNTPIYFLCNRNAICTFSRLSAFQMVCRPRSSGSQCFLYKANGLPDIISISFHGLSSRLKNSRAASSSVVGRHPSQNAICRQMTMASQVLTFPTMLHSLTWCCQTFTSQCDWKMSYLALKPAKPAEISWFPAKQIGERISDVDAAFRAADLHDKLDQAEKYCIAVLLSKIVLHKRHLAFIFF
mgnify:CR=1 FL=1